MLKDAPCKIWNQEERRREARATARARFLAEVEAGRQTLDVLKHPLFLYQHDGMLHLAFTERALLADEMGLGKTIQAIAACGNAGEGDPRVNG